MHGHLEGLKLGAQGTHIGRKLALARRVGSRAELSAERFLRLEDLHGMAALGSCLGRLQTRGAGADNHDALAIGLGNGRHVVLVLAADARIDQTGNRIVGIEWEFATLQTADALMDLAHTAGTCLGRHMRIGERSTTHGDKIAGAHLKKRIGHAGIVNAIGQDHGDANDLANLGAAVGVYGMWGKHRRDNLIGRFARVHAVGAVNGIKANLLQMTTQLQRLGNGTASGNQVVARDAHDHREVLAHVGAHGRGNLVDDAYAIAKTATVAVNATVDRRREELGKQVAMGTVKLHAVEASLLGTCRGGGKISHQLMDLVNGHLASKILASGAGSGAGRDYVEATGRLRHNLTAGMVHLADDLGAGLVHGVDQSFIALNLVVVIQARNTCVALATFLHGIVLGDEQAPAAACLLDHVAHIAVGNHAIERAVVGDHGGHH